MEHSCPRCGAPLPEGAVFCPHCARDIHTRLSLAPPSPLPRKLLLGLLALAVLSAAVCTGLWLQLSPKTYDGYGEVLYPGKNGSYQLLISSIGNRFTPQPINTFQSEPDGQYRTTSCLFVNEAGSERGAGQAFWEEMASVTTAFVGQEDSPSPMYCSPPAYNEAVPEADLVSLLDFTGRSSPAELVWTFSMKNGDTIHLRQQIEVEVIETLDYYPEDYPMRTAEELQALVDQINREVPWPTLVNLHLPPVTYEGGLVIGTRAINLYGSTGESGARTTFTDTVQVSVSADHITYFYDLDFAGEGTGTGVHVSSYFRATGCTFTGWETGVLAGGSSWTNVIGCRFQDNQVGFRFNSSGERANHSLFNDNTFVSNETAVLLEQVPTDITLNFQGCVFSRNRQNILNSCSQPLDLSQAIFE